MEREEFDNLIVALNKLLSEYHRGPINWRDGNLTVTVQDTFDPDTTLVSVDGKPFEIK